MIDEEETFKQFEYRSDDLSSGSHKIVVAICDNCGKVRMTEKRRYKDLCHSCSVMGKKSPRYKERIILICKYCKKEFEVIPNDRNKKRIFCCRECAYKYFTKENHQNWKGGNITIICEWCKKEFKKLPSQKNRRFCCKKCHSKWMEKYQIGENCPAWIDGRSFGKYCKLFNVQFKEKVRISYNRRCFLCGKTEKDNNERLSVHHVNHDKDCLCGTSCEFVPLCRICHTKITGKYIEKYWEDIIICYLYPEQFYMCNI